MHERLVAQPASATEQRSSRLRPNSSAVASSMVARDGESSAAYCSRPSSNVGQFVVHCRECLDEAGLPSVRRAAGRFGAGLLTTLGTTQFSTAC